MKKENILKQLKQNIEDLENVLKQEDKIIQENAKLFDKIYKRSFVGLTKILQYTLRNNKLKIIFEKKDGSERVLIGTLNDDILTKIPEYNEYIQKKINADKKKEGKAIDEKAKTPENPFVIVWDLEKNDWRRVNLDTIIDIDFVD